MPTSLDEKRAEQRRWCLRREWAHVDWPDRLLAAEFLSEDEQHARQAEALRRLIRFCAAGVPFYHEVFRRLGMGPDDVRGVADIVRLPVLTKLDVQDRAAELRPRTAPAKRVALTPSSVQHHLAPALSLARLRVEDGLAHADGQRRNL